MNLPKISVVTPSYNQADYLERTIRSVIEQNYPELEFIIIDGGSTDGSIDVIKKYEKYLTYWVSESDNGQSHAINKGLKMATGDWVAWQNSDDIYYGGAFHAVADAALKHPDVALIIGDMNLIDQDDKLIRDLHFVTPSYGAMVAEGMVLSNQAAFWRRDIHDKIGWMDETLHTAFDFDWFLRLTKNVKGYAVNKCLGAFRIHSAAKTQVMTSENSENYAFVRKRHNAYMSPLRAKLYLIKRLLLLLLRGDLAYIARGFAKRIEENNLMRQKK